MVHRFASDVLAGQGYRVAEESNGVEGLILADDSLDISVLVTDIVMPQMSGPELAERLQEMRPGLRTLFISGYLFDEELSIWITRLRRGHFGKRPTLPTNLVST